MYAQLEINALIVFFAKHVSKWKLEALLIVCCKLEWMNTAVKIDFYSKSEAQKDDNNEIELDVINEIYFGFGHFLYMTIILFFKQGGSFHDQCLIFICKPPFLQD